MDRVKDVCRSQNKEGTTECRPKRRLTVMPDFGMAPWLWESDDGCSLGTCVADAVAGATGIGLSPSLEEKAGTWAACFERHFREFTPDDWQDFHVQGMKIAQLLAGEVSDRYQVFYRKAWEDPDHGSREAIEVQPQDATDAA